MKEKDLKIEELIQQNQMLIDSNLQYQQILEKTNNQLGLRSDPHATSVAVLGILFTVLTIIATVLIWWQSKEHRKMVREELDNVINKQRKEAIELIEEVKRKKELELTEAADDQKSIIQSQLDTLKEREIDIKTGQPDLSQYMKKEDYLCKDCRNILTPSWRVGLFEVNLNFEIQKKCVSCGKDF